jgi:DNA gyrase inhibitor GyrI
MVMEVRIVDLPPMRVVSALGYGKEPELQAWGLIESFARTHEIDLWSGAHRFFGFNNPNPSPGSPDYGYEQWMTLEEGIEPEAPLEVKAIPGGKYAVTTCEGLQNITETWREFVRWFEDSGYRWGPNCEECLEELKTPLGSPIEEWVFDLYLPIEA